jgi:hypothetical protein
MRYIYKVCGIVFESDIYYPQLFQSDEKPEVKIAYGEVPEHLDEKNIEFHFIEANPKQYLIKLEKIGKYLIENGSTITIQKYDQGSSEDLERFVLTNILGAISYMRNFIPMHGGVVIKDNQTFLISGASGKGKSTLLASLLNKGYTLVSDDISNVKVEDGIPYVYPGFQYLLLWKDTMKLCGIENKNYDKLLSENEKYFYPIPENQFKNERVKLDNMIILFEKEEDEDIQITGLKKIETLKINTFKPWMIQAFDKNKFLFGELIKMGNHISLFKFDCNHKKPIDKSITRLIKLMEEICLTKK